MSYKRTPPAFLKEVERFLRNYFREYNPRILVITTDACERHAHFDTIGHVGVYMPCDTSDAWSLVRNELLMVWVPEVNGRHGCMEFNARHSTHVFRLQLDPTNYWLTLGHIKNEVRDRFPLAQEEDQAIRKLFD
jgi:hypothetical protein